MENTKVIYIVDVTSNVVVTKSNILYEEKKGQICNRVPRLVKISNLQHWHNERANMGWTCVSNFNES